MFSRKRSALFLPIVALSLILLANAFPGNRDERNDGQQVLQGGIRNDNDEPNTIPHLLDALDVLDREYFAIWQGIWPTSIDWTSAVIGTFLASALNTLSSSFKSSSFNRTNENAINKYFSQLTSSYFGQDAFSLRQEAYDDMLWVVLGWLEGIKFIEAHAAEHYKDTTWHGEQFIPAFAHRARIFWELAAQGWDTKFCNGGMIWSPYLIPYKNAITNELFISASISMYLSFPGDSNHSPFLVSGTGEESARYLGKRDPMFLNAALEGYQWLVDSNMTNSNGLFVDGYHISGRSNNQCDARNEMVYTYNQGVLLTGQRGLYEATGQRRFLQDGHKLISDVIRATGWDLRHGRVLPERFGESPNQFPQWHGLGRSGILEEICDMGAYCSQDAQTFKGIFFHHFTTFCQLLPVPLNGEKKFEGSMSEDQKWHAGLCQSYQGWVKHNAKAALRTKDSNGRFGMWWGAPDDRDNMPDIIDVVLPKDAVDYRNKGVPGKWIENTGIKHTSPSTRVDSVANQPKIQDFNDRGRGRTVETQGGGLSVLRALQESFLLLSRQR